jgi:hypothetical protein
MAERKPFLLRLDPETFAALQAWAADDLRSANGQAEFLLRRALRAAGRLPGRGGSVAGAGRRELGEPGTRLEAGPSAPARGGPDGES